MCANGMYITKSHCHCSRNETNNKNIFPVNNDNSLCPAELTWRRTKMLPKSKQASLQCETAASPVLLNGPTSGQLTLKCKWQCCDSKLLAFQFPSHLPFLHPHPHPPIPLFLMSMYLKWNHTKKLLWIGSVFSVFIPFICLGLPHFTVCFSPPSCLFSLFPPCISSYSPLSYHPINTLLACASKTASFLAPNKREGLSVSYWGGTVGGWSGWTWDLLVSAAFALGC